MIVPVPALWTRHTLADPHDQIDRVIYSRTHRLMAGISLNAEFSKVVGVLAVAVGQGKFLRLRHTIEASVEIPSPISQACRELAESPSKSLPELLPLLADLAEIQATVVEKIKCQAGKYVDRVMAVAVTDPGLWTEDFDGRLTFTSFCDPAQLAELSGVTVIDNFPARDIAVGGRGDPLDAIPVWMLVADRNEKIAEKRRALLNTDGTGTGYVLPPSDGLDASLPAITELSTSGCGYLNRLAARIQAKGRLRFDNMYADGTSNQDLYRRLAGLISKSESPNTHLVPFRKLQQTDIDEAMMSVAEAFLRDHPQKGSSLVRTSVTVVVDRLAEQLESPRKTSEVFIAASSALEASVIHRLEQRVEGTDIHPISKLSFSNEGLPAVVAAMLGLLHIDQMPANVPWLTGASSQRILGRITPGRPANWRQLIRSMADFQPAAMKLKDAV